MWVVPSSGRAVAIETVSPPGASARRRRTGRAHEAHLAQGSWQHRVVPAQLARMLRPAAPVEVGRRGAGDHLAAREAARRSRRPAGGAPPRMVTSKVSVHALDGPRRRQPMVTLGYQLVKGRQVLGELVHGEGRRRQLAQVAARLAGGTAGQRLGLLDLGEMARDALEVKPADVGQCQAARGAVDQPRAEMLLGSATSRVSRRRATGSSRAPRRRKLPASMTRTKARIE